MVNLDHWDLEKLVVEVAINFGFTYIRHSQTQQLDEQLLVDRERIPLVRIPNVSSPRIDVVVGLYEQYRHKLIREQLNSLTREIYLGFMREWCMISQSTNAKNDLEHINRTLDIPRVRERHNPRYFFAFEIENSDRRKLLVGTIANVSSVSYRAVIIVPKDNYHICANIIRYLRELKMRGKWRLPDLFENVYFVAKEEFINYIKNKRRDRSWKKILHTSL